MAPALAPAAASAADRTVTVTGSAPKGGWDGAAASGANMSLLATDGECGKDPDTYCDDTLVHVDV